MEFPPMSHLISSHKKIDCVTNCPHGESVKLQQFLL